MKKLSVLSQAFFISSVCSAFTPSFNLSLSLGSSSQEPAIVQSAPSVTTILDKHYTHSYNYALLPHEAADELSLHDAITVMNRAITPLGIWALTKMTHPLTDISIIEQRQKVLKQLVSHHHLYKDLTITLSTMKNITTELLPYFNESDVLTIEARNMFFNFAPSTPGATKLSRLQRFNNYLNSNSIALECGPFIGVGIFAAQFFIQRAINNIGLEFMRETETNAAQKTQSNHFLQSIRAVWNGALKTVATPLVMHLPQLYSFQGHTSNDLADAKFRTDELRYGSNLSIADQALDYQQRLGFTPTNSYLCAAGYVAFLDVVGAFVLYQNIKSLNESNNIINKLRARLTHIATIIKETEQLYDICMRNALLQELPAVKALQAFIQNPPPEIASLIALLHSSTFTGSKSFFYRRGRVLFAHRKLLLIKDQLLPLLRAIAEIDAYLSMATLIKEHETKTNHYCFVTFDTSSTHPHAEFKNFWLPLLNVSKPVLNSLTLGAQKTESLLLAGPNGSGKSTFMKTIAYNWGILPLSWGIAAADSADITPLKHIRTSINIHENIQEGKSTYMAQSTRFDQLMALVQSNDMGNTLLLIDEPLNGTVESIAAQRTVELGIAVAQRKQCCAVIATHLEKPTHLDDITGAFSNYYPEVIEDTVGFFKQTYRLLHGKAEWWFNDIAKQDRFDRWLKRHMAQSTNS